MSLSLIRFEKLGTKGFLVCALLWAPEGESERSEECPKGRAYKSCGNMYSDKIAIVQKKVCPLFGPTASPVLVHILWKFDFSF